MPDGSAAVQPRVCCVPASQLSPPLGAITATSGGCESTVTLQNSLHSPSGQPAVPVAAITLQLEVPSGSAASWDVPSTPVSTSWSERSASHSWNWYALLFA